MNKQQIEDIKRIIDYKQERIDGFWERYKKGYSKLIREYKQSCVDDELIIKVLKKQIPKKPIVDPANLCDFQNFYCPKCNKHIVSKLDGEWLAGRLQNYCDDCGQALDWSEHECTTT